MMYRLSCMAVFFVCAVLPFGASDPVSASIIRAIRCPVPEEDIS